MSGPLFLFRWSVRLLRREWRQQLGVLALILAGVALSVGAVIAAFNLTEPPGSSFGTGNLDAQIYGDVGEVNDALESQGHQFGIIQRVVVRQPGSAQFIAVRSQDPENRVTAPLLALVEGQWPTTADEIGVTDEAPTDSREIGQTIELGGRERRIVAIVENPTSFKDEFVLTRDIDSFGIDKRFQTASALVEGRPLDVTFPAGTVAGISDDGGDLTLRTFATIAVSIVMAIALIIVALLSGASFAVLARRRARQYGLLAAAGATPRQVRQAVALSGLTTGLVAATIGALIGLAVTWAVVPRLENTVGHRIDFAAPWWTIVPTVLLAIVATTVAAWWPARALSRQSIVEVISALRPQRSASKRSSVLGVFGAVAGTVVLVIGVQAVSATLVIVGLCLAMFGLLLLSPGLVQLIGQRSKDLPLSGRMAGRSIARQGGRSAAFVAALSLALAIPVGVATVTASIDQHNATKAPNLDDNMAVLWSPGVDSDTTLIPSERDAAAIDAAGARLDGVSATAKVAPIQLVLDPFGANAVATVPGVGPVPGTFTLHSITPVDLTTCGTNCEADTIGDRDAVGNEIVVSFRNTWLANPELLDALGIADQTFPHGLQAISRHDDAKLVTHRDHEPDRQSNVGFDADIPPNPSIGSTLILPEFAEANGWDVVTVGWLLVNDEPLTDAQLAAVDEAAGETMLTEAAVAPASTASIRLVAILVGILLGLGITVAALALLRAESADDVRLLQAIGAAPQQHRRLSAMTAGILTSIALLIAIPTGSLAVLVLLADKFTNYRFVIPWLSFAALLLLLPTLAAAMGWVTSKTHTTNLGRRLT